MLSQWTYVHQDTGGATVNATLNNVIQLEGVTSLVHQVGALSPSAVNSIDIMGWGGGITDNTTLVRTCFSFVQNLYGVFAIMQDSLDVSSVCYAATFSSDTGVIALWKDSIANILFGMATPVASAQSVEATPPLRGCWAISLLTQYNSSINTTQITVSTSLTTIGLPIVEAPGQFPPVSVALLGPPAPPVPPTPSTPGVIFDTNPLVGGVNAGIFSAQAGSFVASTNLDDFDVTQIFTT